LDRRLKVTDEIRIIMLDGLRQALQTKVVNLFNVYSSGDAPANRADNLRRGVKKYIKDYEQVQKIIIECASEDTG
jgi:hypothetical protein